MAKENICLGMIGGGVMGEAILSRLVAQRVYLAEKILVSEPNPQRRDYLQQQYKVRVTADNRLVAESSPVLLLAIKPQVLTAVAADLVNEGQADYESLVISILAGVPLEKLSTVFPDRPIIRVMPNTPAIIGAGITAIAAGENVRPEQIKTAKSIFASVGQVVEVPEYQMDAVTGLSGSGPAFVAIAIEALADGGVAAGLPRAISQQLAIQTVLGTAKLLQESKLHPAQLKDRVTSPGGTTIAGVAELESNGFRSAIIEAVQAAYYRSQQLGLINS